MTDSTAKKSKNNHYRGGRRHSTSFFGPFVMIGVGGYFLLNNLGYIGSVRWEAALRLWPLLLVFLGINMIVQMVPRPFGSFMSFLVSATAVALFGYVLLAEDVPYINKLGNSEVSVTTEEISYAPDDIDSANINLDLNSAGAQVFMLDDSKKLIEGQVSFTGDMTFKTSESGGEADVSLRTDSGRNLFFLNPGNWNEKIDPWQIGLSPRVETDLTVDVGSGATTLDLASMTLSDLVIDGGSGGLNVTLPDGEYEVKIDAASGSSQLALSDNGQQVFKIDGASGRIEIELPDSMEARIEVDGGSGSFSLDTDRFTQVQGDESDEGVWETAAYDDATDRVEFVIDVGSGSITIR